MKLLQNSKIKLAVMFGGLSAEHEISIITALQAIRAIDTCRYEIIPVYIALNGKWYCGESLLDKHFYKNFSNNFSHVQEVSLLPDPSIRGLISIGKKNQRTIPIDVCLLAFHGQFVEDGCIQGLLELADIPYTGCGVAASSMAMDKYQCKMFLKSHHIPVLPGTTISKKMAISDLGNCLKHIFSQNGLKKYPLFVKPNSLGSSIGISSANNDQELAAALAKVFIYDDTAIIEPYLTKNMELNVSVLDGDPPIPSVVEIPISQNGEALTFEDKYLRGGNKIANREGMASLTRIIDPPHLDQSTKTLISEYALKAFSLLKCSGVVRFDFMLDTEKGIIYFNELNPIPGSLSFYLWEKSHPSLLYTDLINRLVNLAIKRKEDQLSLKRNVGFRAL